MKSNKTEIINFTKTALWSDIQEQIDHNITSCFHRMEIQDDITMEEFHRLRGEIKSYRKLLDLPQTLIEAMEN